MPVLNRCVLRMIRLATLKAIVYRDDLLLCRSLLLLLFPAMNTANSYLVVAIQRSSAQDAKHAFPPRAQIKTGERGGEHQIVDSQEDLPDTIAKALMDLKSAFAGTRSSLLAPSPYFARDSVE